MHCLAAFIVIVALWSTPSVQSVDCSDQYALKMEMTKCLTQSGLSVDPKSSVGVLNAILSNTSHACSNSEAYKTTFACVIHITKTCLKSSGRDTVIVPDIKQITDGIDYLCDHAADVDAECLTRTQPAITKCVLLTSSKFTTCILFDATPDCLRQQLSVCSGRTNEIAANYFMHFIPTACRSQKSESSGGPREADHDRVDNLDAADSGLRLTDRTENVAWPGAQKTNSEVNGGTSAGGTWCVFLLFAALLAVICRYISKRWRRIQY